MRGPEESSNAGVFGKGCCIKVLRWTRWDVSARAKELTLRVLGGPSLLQIGLGARTYGDKDDYGALGECFSVVACARERRCGFRYLEE